MSTKSTQWKYHVTHGERKKKKKYYVKLLIYAVLLLFQTNCNLRVFPPNLYLKNFKTDKSCFVKLWVVASIPSQEDHFNGNAYNRFNVSITESPNCLMGKKKKNLIRESDMFQLKGLAE